VKGFGTRLMNKLKDHCKKDGYKYFLTYADNNAIGYFKKQGFHKNLKMPMEQWKDYIKDYDGGTLMEAEIDPKIDYSNLSEILKEQKKCIEKYTKKFLNVKRKYSYKEFEDEIKKKGIDLNALKKKNKDNEETIEITEELFNCIPGMKESGWTFNDYKIQCENERQGDNVNFLTQCRNIIKKLNEHTNSWPFKRPVDKLQVPDYYDKILEPMDLQTLEKNLESGRYKKKEDFENDLKKIFNNARKYNKQGTIYYKFADELEKYISEDINKLKNC
jgi:histone acetyltransferase